MLLWIILGVLIWIACGILDVGILRLIPDTDLDAESAAIMTLLGPFALVILVYVVFCYYVYSGLVWVWERILENSGE